MRARCVLVRRLVVASPPYVARSTRLPRCRTSPPSGAVCSTLVCASPSPALTAGWVMVRAGHDSGCECDTLAFRTGQEDTLEGHSPDGGRVSCRPHSQRVLGARHRRALCVSEDGYRHDEALLVTGSRTGCTRIHRPGPSPCPRKGVRLGALAVARRSSRLSFPRVY